MTAGLDHFIGSLERVKQTGDGEWIGSCPAAGHGQGRGDIHPSLSINRGNGSGPLLHCHAGCDNDSILAGVGMAWPELLPPKETDRRKPSPREASRTSTPKQKTAPGTITRYEIRDADGKLEAIHVREDHADGKNIRWELPDGTPNLKGRKLETLPLYGIARLSADATVPVVVCEGEKATDALLSNGIPAAGTVTGSGGTPGDDALRPLLGRTVYLWPDCDETGRKHMNRIGAALIRLGHNDVRLIDWKGAPDTGDAADLFALEGARDDFDTLIDEARPLMSAIADKPAVSISPKAPLFASLSTLLANPRPQRWLVKGLIEAPSTVMVFGPSGCGKTFIVVDMAGATATEGEWCGRRVSGGPVYYIVGEGRIGLLRRFQAWQLKRKVRIPEDRLFLSVVSIELNASGAAEVAMEVERRAKDTGEPPALIIVDTLSRMMPAGDDENSVKDMMAFVKAVDQIRDRFDCVAVIVHHAGVADDKRARGSTSLKAAMDAELCIAKRGAIRTAEWTKLKDLPEEPHPQEFALEPELLGQDEDGNLITSAVVSWQGRAAMKTATSTTKAENLGLETLRAATATKEGPVSVEAWRFVFYSRHWGEDNGAKRKAFARVRESLAGKGLIQINEGDYSIPMRDSGTGRDKAGHCPEV